MYKKGQYVICRYDGSNNGDTIIGRIESVRATGHIEIADLVTPGKMRTKRADVLAKRNTVVSKRVALQLLALAGKPNFRAIVAKEGKRLAAPPPADPYVFVTAVYGTERKGLKVPASTWHVVLDALRVAGAAPVDP